MKRFLVGVDSHSVSVASRRKNQFRVLGQLAFVSVDLSLHSKTVLRCAGIADGSACWAGAAHGLLDGGFGRDAAEADLLRAQGHIGVVRGCRVTFLEPISVKVCAKIGVI